MRLFIPSILVIAAIGLFVVYTNPTYQASKALSAQVASYDDALTKSKELRKVRDDLLSKRSTFSTDNVQKLEKVLPDNVDNIRFIIDINNIALRHSISLKNVQLGTIGGTSNSQAAASISSAGSLIGTADIGFSVTASYSDLYAFLQDIEHSLRLIDVQKLGFSVTPGITATDYSFTIRTYWLH